MDRFPEVQVAYDAPLPPVTIAEIRTALGYDDPWHRACYGCGKTAVTRSAYVCTYVYRRRFVDFIPRDRTLAARNTHA